MKFDRFYSGIIPISQWIRRAIEHVTYPPDMSREDFILYRSVSSFTMTSPERIIALRDSTKYLCHRRLPGDIVECGVWRGGSMMVVANELLRLREMRVLHLFDTFEGMTDPSEKDVSHAGKAAFNLLASSSRKSSSKMWCVASEEDVRNNLYSTGYPKNFINFIRGKVEDTLPGKAPKEIALLRLDTDWYDSTWHELLHLYPNVVSGGVIIIDDYGYWQGARRAVDEYFSNLEPAPLLIRIDSTARILIKP